MLRTAPTAWKAHLHKGVFKQSTGVPDPLTDNSGRSQAAIHFRESHFAHAGIEPGTSRMVGDCSTTEPRGRRSFTVYSVMLFYGKITVLLLSDGTEQSS